MPGGLKSSEVGIRSPGTGVGVVVSHHVSLEEPQDPARAMSALNH